MDCIRLSISVPASVALRDGTGKAGLDVAPLTPEVLGALTADERALLAQLYVAPTRDQRIPPRGELVQEPGKGASSLTLPTADTSPAAVVVTLRAALQGFAAKVEALAAKVEGMGKAALVIDGYGIHRSVGIAYGPARDLCAAAPSHPVVTALAARAAEREVALRAKITAEALAAGPDLLVSDGAHGRRVANTPAWWCDVPELVALCRAAEERAAEKDAEDRARVEARRAAEERAAASKAARAEVVSAALRAYALTVPELAPAAEDGYDVTPGVLDHIAALVADAARAAGASSTEVVVSGTRAWEAWDMEERSAPKPAAVKAQRALREACARIAVPDGVHIAVEKVQRVTREEGGEKRRETSLVAQVLCEAGMPRAVLAALE